MTRIFTNALIILSSVVCFSKTYNILGIFPYSGKSHMMVFEPFMKGLAKQGHNVTVISQFPLEEPIKNYQDVVIVDNEGGQVNVHDIEGHNPFKRYRSYMSVFILYRYAEKSCRTFFESKSVQDFLKSDSSFDAIIAEVFNGDCVLAMADKFKAPIIGITSCVFMPWAPGRLGNPMNPAYVPNHFLDYSDRMTFLERVENTLVTIFDEMVYDFFILKQDEEIIEEYLKYHIDMKEFVKNTSLILTNTHFSLNLPMLLLPNIVEVGGLHVGKPKSLPKNIEKWINESSEGVIYFSLGSMIKGHTFPEEKRQAFLKAFGRLPQRVLWKWENDTMPGKPDNVMIQKWMPQFDILCHPNVKAFISHGGLLGMTEAVHCGVPVIVMPQYGDQHTNARALEANGGGVILQLTEATENKVYEALKQVLSPSFRQQAKDLSERFRDRPLPPLETAIYWVEYVARHKGAPHMRTAAVGMPFYQYYLLDVIGFLLAVALTFLYINYLIVKFFIRLLFGKSKKVKQS